MSPYSMKITVHTNPLIMNFTQTHSSTNLIYPPLTQKPTHPPIIKQLHTNTLSHLSLYQTHDTDTLSMGECNTHKPISQNQYPQIRTKTKQKHSPLIKHNIHQSNRQPMHPLIKHANTHPSNTPTKHTLTHPQIKHTNTLIHQSNMRTHSPTNGTHKHTHPIMEHTNTLTHHKHTHQQWKTQTHSSTTNKFTH